MPSCDDRGVSFSREDNLRRHKNHHCNSSEQLTEEEPCGAKRRWISVVSTVHKDPESDYDIPSFDGDEFCGNKSKSRETFNRMMKMLKLPKHRWDRIATAELLE